MDELDDESEINSELGLDRNQDSVVNIHARNEDAESKFKLFSAKKPKKYKVLIANDE